MAAPQKICDPTSQNVRAFLKLLRWLENYPDDDDKVYYKLFGGATFTDTSKHPNQNKTTGWGKTSSAAGAYMILYGTWKEAYDNGVVTDFTPTSQDKLAWWKIGQRHAQVAVCGGRNTLLDAFSKLRAEWSSLPGASQSQVSQQAAMNRYELYLLQFAPAGQKTP
jgi:lysozyme